MTQAQKLLKAQTRHVKAETRLLKAQTKLCEAQATKIDIPPKFG